MNIEINEALLPVLQDYAGRDGITPEVWIQRKAEAVLMNLIKNSIFSNVDVLKGDDLITMNTAFETTLVAIRQAKAEPFAADPNFPNTP